MKIRKEQQNESTNRENYLLTADTYNIILNKRYKKQTKEGEPAQYGWRQSAFYPTIEKAFLGLLEKKIKDSDVATVNELIEEIRLAKSEIAAASFQYKLKGIQNEFITFYDAQAKFDRKLEEERELEECLRIPNKILAFYQELGELFARNGMGI